MLIITLLLGFGFGTLPASFGQTVPPPAPSAPATPTPPKPKQPLSPKKQAAKEKKKTVQVQKNQAKRGELSQKYGMTLEQIQQYEALQQVCREKTAEVRKTPGLPRKERRQKIKTANKEFHASVNGILTPAQRAMVAGYHNQQSKQNEQAHKVLTSYRKERKALNTHHNLSNRAESLAQLNKKYKSESEYPFRAH